VDEMAGTFLFLAPGVAGLGLTGSVVATVLWSGRWRALGALPLVALAAYMAAIVVPDTLNDPSSHNLLPFEIGVYFWPSAVYMGVLAAVRRGTAKRAERPDATTLRPHRGTLILVFAVLGLFGCVPLGIAAWIIANHDLAEMTKGHMDPSGRSVTKMGRFLGILGVALATVIVVATLAFMW
jgi:hypothetical protein